MHRLEADSSDDLLELMTSSGSEGLDAWERMLSPLEVVKWGACSEATSACCAAQVAEPEEGEESRDQCEITWDGYSCWGRAAAGSDVAQFCQEYIPHSLPTRELKN